ncbi:MAG: hypothetical protein RIR04_1403 [Pseudomonadota bacterium]
MLFDRLRSWFRPRTTVEVEPASPPAPGRQRGVVDHVIILDGTLSTLEKGQEGNCGLLFRLLTENGISANRTVYYEPGHQWDGWRNFPALAQGTGINAQIRRAYGWLASHYREGDRIYLFGYSRGAYAVRSLAGVIDRIGLLTRQNATERMVRQSYRHYKTGPDSPAARAFAALYCHRSAPIQMVGVWDTVKALGVRLPLLWMLTDKQSAFHNHQLGASVRHGFHALAIHETRAVFDPVLWECPEGRESTVQQVWFRGAHGDIGGHIGRFAACRPLANIPFVWMLENAERVGLLLPAGWVARFPCDPKAPMVGTFRGVGMIFLLRRARVIGRDRSESIHETAQGQRPFSWTPWPLTRLY